MTTAFHATSLVRAAKDHLSCELDGSTVILQMGSGTYFGLDAVGSTVWRMIQQRCTVGDIHSALVTEYEVAPEVCMRDLEALLESLREANLIEVTDGPAGEAEEPEPRR